RRFDPADRAFAEEVSDRTEDEPGDAEHQTEHDAEAAQDRRDGRRAVVADRRRRRLWIPRPVVRRHGRRWRWRWGWRRRGDRPLGLGTQRSSARAITTRWIWLVPS